MLAATIASQESDASTTSVPLFDQGLVGGGGGEGGGVRRKRLPLTQAHTFSHDSFIVSVGILWFSLH